MRKDAIENRQRIEETALQLFNEEGVNNVSMNRIAKQLGVGMGTLYRHFKDKGDLCYSLIQRDVDDFLAELYQTKDQYHSEYDILNASLTLLLQFKVDNQSLLHCIEQNKNKTRFFQSKFYQQLFDFYYSIFDKLDTQFATFKADMLIHSLSTQIFEFQREDRKLSIDQYKAFLLQIYYTDEVTSND
ncbi:TetR/AcrR family transcriptional regulator [Staphylococcus simiae]|uniref:TetR/AcrR family transcriptional regulator n=1 Tax=Staphylococcus simiae TaxID=308354 RepID=UPI001A96FC60|nr:TetR/AcrR family transcriptional regulator [Staphylococcus simiae]MBO1198196.1 TetR/AcrR family transcriptional regulator [Staphylococcus simiae]MBO1200260.1 TetR/AcrR family transcriptional regulator [Staphylococcus simiae]MBO1202576.1 TetR/AcrR family transcriptional regulator [Staphylococcus simiae]MBO1210146.1 TetR/AcrR family transcriptional regulator [Staphylococcus simiae]MBO1228720.1 TetR/AcrR family transcriptional regulator [Staphylococcus simiae]